MKDVSELKAGDKILLRWDGQDVAVLEASSIYKPNKVVEAKECYGTSSLEHPTVYSLIAEQGAFYVGGKLHGLKSPAFKYPTQTPSEVRAQLPEGKERCSGVPHPQAGARAAEGHGCGRTKQLRLRRRLPSASAVSLGRRASGRRGRRLRRVDWLGRRQPADSDGSRPALWPAPAAARSDGPLASARMRGSARAALVGFGRLGRRRIGPALGPPPSPPHPAPRGRRALPPNPSTSSMGAQSTLAIRSCTGATACSLAGAPMGYGHASRLGETREPVPLVMRAAPA